MPMAFALLGSTLQLCHIGSMSRLKHNGQNVCKPVSGWERATIYHCQKVKLQALLLSTCVKQRLYRGRFSI